MTELEQAMSLALAARLNRTSDPIQQCVGALITSRQLYAVAVRELELQLTDMSAEGRTKIVRDCVNESSIEIPEDVQDPDRLFGIAEQFLLASAANKAAQPFSEVVLASAMRAAVKWAAEVCARHENLEKAERARQLDEAEAERRKRSIRVPFWKPDLGIDRHRPTLLVGWQPALLWLVDEILDAAFGQADNRIGTVLRLRAAPQQRPPTGLVMGLAPNQWRDCARSPKHCGAWFNRIRESLETVVDLIVVEDLAKACVTGGVIGSGEAVAASTAQKTLRKLAAQVGAGLLLCMPQPGRELPDFMDLGWDNLKAFTAVTAVAVTQPDEDVYNLQIGADLLLTVPAEDMVRYTGGTVLTA